MCIAINLCGDFQHVLDTLRSSPLLWYELTNVDMIQAFGALVGVLCAALLCAGSNINSLGTSLV